MESPDYKGLTGSAESIQIHLIRGQRTARIPEADPTLTLVPSARVLPTHAIGVALITTWCYAGYSGRHRQRSRLSRVLACRCAFGDCTGLQLMTGGRPIAVPFRFVVEA